MNFQDNGNKIDTGLIDTIIFLPKKPLINDPFFVCMFCDIREDIVTAVHTKAFVFLITQHGDR